MPEVPLDEPDAGASPPCFLHEFAQSRTEGFSSPEPADVRQWRRAERERLLQLRRRIDGADRRRFDAAICSRLAEWIGDVRDLTIAGYFPIAAEPDVGELMASVVARGGRWSLPVVERKAAPLIFRTWAPSEPLERGIGGIPVPTGGDTVVPDIVLAPVVGFDPACFRLGYGGGYFDRTLAAVRRRPRVAGVGYACLRIPTIHPQPHDIPMDVVVTEDMSPAPRPPRNGESSCL